MIRGLVPKERLLEWSVEREPLCRNIAVAVAVLVAGVAAAVVRVRGWN